MEKDNTLDRLSSKMSSGPFCCILCQRVEEDLGYSAIALWFGTSSSKCLTKS